MIGFLLLEPVEAIAKSLKISPKYALNFRMLSKY